MSLFAALLTLQLRCPDAKEKRCYFFSVRNGNAFPWHPGYLVRASLHSISGSDTTDIGSLFGDFISLIICSNTYGVIITARQFLILKSPALVWEIGCCCAALAVFLSVHVTRRGGPVCSGLVPSALHVSRFPFFVYAKQLH